MSRASPSPVTNQYICLLSVLFVPQASAVHWLTRFQCGQSRALRWLLPSSQSQAQGFLWTEGHFPYFSAIGWPCRFDSGVMDPSVYSCHLESSRGNSDYRIRPFSHEFKKALFFPTFYPHPFTWLVGMYCYAYRYGYSINCPLKYLRDCVS